MLQHTDNTLHHTATHCNTLQHTATLMMMTWALQNTATYLQHPAPHCKALQRTATHCNLLQHTAGNMTARYTGLADGADIDDDDFGLGEDDDEAQVFFFCIYDIDSFVCDMTRSYVTCLIRM